jgi:hypothetical protein
VTRPASSFSSGSGVFALFSLPEQRDSISGASVEAGSGEDGAWEARSSTGSIFSPSGADPAVMRAGSSDMATAARGKTGSGGGRLNPTVAPSSPSTSGADLAPRWRIGRWCEAQI